MANAPAKIGLDDEPLELNPGAVEDPDAGTLDDEGGKKAGEDGQDDLEVVILEDDDAKGGTENEDLAQGAAGEDLVAKPGAGDEDDVDEGLSAEDKKTLSRDMQNRVRREVRLRKRLVSEAEGRAQSEAIARRAAERKSLEYEVTLAGVVDTNIESQIKQVAADLTAAKEAGESAKEVELLQKLNELQNSHRAVKAGRVSAEERLEKAKTAPAKPATTLRPITQQWMGRNKWFEKEGFEAQTAAARAIDAKMGKEGLDPSTPEYYAEFDRRINKEMPNLRQRLKTGDVVRRPIVGEVQRSAPRSAGRPGTITLTRSQVDNMKSYGLDPTNKTHILEYAKNVGVPA